MYKVLDIIQDSPEWHELRRHHIGASNCAAILGKSKYKSPYMVWEEMVRGKKTETNAAMQRGKDLEPGARAIISSRHRVHYQPMVLQSKKYEWMIASMDCWNEHPKMGGEIKCPGDKGMVDFLEKGVPSDYLWQMQHQMAVNGCAEQFLYVFHPDMTHIEIKVKRDEKMIEELVEAEREFYYNHILEFTPPPLCDLDYEERNDYDWLNACESFLRAKELADQYVRAVESHKEKLIQIANGKNTRGAGITLFWTSKRGPVDYKAIPELKEVNLDQYRKGRVESWVIRT